MEGVKTKIRHLDYDSLAKIYATIRDASEIIVRHVHEYMENNPPTKILEVGCGTADHLCAFAKLFKAEGFGFDKSARMIEEGNRKNPGLCLQQGNASESYPYLDRSFDFVFSVNVIHYIDDLNCFFKEAFRVLRASGVVLTVTDSWEDIRRRTTSQYFPESVEIELQRYPAVEILIRAMRKAGFREIQTSSTEHLFPLGEKELWKFRNKAFSALRLLPEDVFQKGLKRLEDDMSKGQVMGRELYTYIWGRKVAQANREIELKEKRRY